MLHPGKVRLKAVSDGEPWKSLKFKTAGCYGQICTLRKCTLPATWRMN